MIAALLACVAADLVAQTPTAGDAAKPADTETSEQYFKPERSAWTFTGDVLVRYDEVTDLVGREDLERGRLRVRPAVVWEPASWLTFEGRLVASVGTDDNADNARNLDNFKSDDVDLDRLFVSIHPGRNLDLRVGKMGNTLRSSEMVWDADVQPLGAMGVVALFGGDDSVFDRIALSGFAWTLGEPYDEEYDVQILGGQAAAFFRFGSFATDIAAIYYDFDDLDPLLLPQPPLSPRFARQNRSRIVAGRREFVSEFELGELIWEFKWNIGFPFFGHLDVVRNFGVEGNGANDLRDGIEITLGGGKLEEAGDFRFAYTFQDVERDAVLTAVTSDDWWFHSFFGKGHRLALAVAYWKKSYVQGSYITAQRDDQQDPVQRLIADVVFRW